MLLLFAVNTNGVVEAHDCNCNLQERKIEKNFTAYTKLIGETKEKVFLKYGHNYYPAEATAESFCKDKIRIYFADNEQFSVRAVSIANSSVNFKGARVGRRLESFVEAFGKPIAEDLVESYASFADNEQKITVFYYPTNKKVLSVYIEKMPETKQQVLDGAKFLPESINGVYLGSNISYKLSETKSNEKLEQAIRVAYGISEKLEQKNYYYYNLVDLNNDNIPEVFVYLVGPYFSGSGGSSALIFTEDLNGYKLVNRFSLMHNPIIVSENKTNGWHDLVVQVAGGGSKYGLVELKFVEGKYPENPSVQERLGKERVIVGMAIIADDLQIRKGISFQ